MTIGQKLGYNFGALVAVALGLGVAEWWTASSVGSELEETAKGAAVKLGRAQEIGKYIQQIDAANRGAQLGYINDDAEYVETNRRLIESSAGSIAQAIKDIRSLAATPDTQRSLDAIENGLAAWLPLSKQYLMHGQQKE